MYKICILALFFFSCNQVEAPDKEKIKKEIVAAEKLFADDLKKNGVAAAFFDHAAPDAVIKRENDTLIKGNTAIREYYSRPAYKNAVAEWSPDLVDVSEDGTMAYTYGRYKWNFTDSAGKISIYEGVFHTVWKRMKDGNWKYVWD